jgi:MoaA/NifB/PqqE/SkfB family radical SAM enzyme/protein-L-isoaspartate O-methyltransferase
VVTLTGGEPLLREDLPEILQAFDPRSCLVLGTTGEGLTAERARSLRDSGLFAVGISLDSDQEVEHDRARGRPGAFRSALAALRVARESGLYPYVVSVATREFLQRSRFLPFLRFAAEAGALEVHLLEPSATGKLAGRTEVLLTAAERQQIFDYQDEIARGADLPILSSFAYLESPEAFGCGAGLTHLYIDGSGEVCPCNLVPLSFGNIAREPLRSILGRMGQHFCRPRTGCVGRLLVNRLPRVGLPTPPETSDFICHQHLPRQHALPAFFRIRDEVQGTEVGAAELREAYDRVHRDYDEFWLVSAAKPTSDLVQKMDWCGSETVFEAGCGTGYATALLASRSAQVIAVDLSAAMQTEARARIRARGYQNVRFITGDALAALNSAGYYDRIFSSWVLGYIPLVQFFAAACRALKPGGQLGFVVHRENSPREALEIFGELVAEDPTVLQKEVAFDFPRDTDHVRTLLHAAGFEIQALWQDSIVFPYGSPEQVLEHLLKSGAGTAFHDAIDPARRPALTKRFLQMLTSRHPAGTDIEVRHDYVASVASRAE